MGTVSYAKIGEQVTKMAQRHTTCDYILGEVMQYIINNKDELPCDYQVDWAIRNYKKYIEGKEL